MSFNIASQVIASVRKARTRIGQSNQDRTDRWSVIVRPPEEYDADPRDFAERLIGGLHGFERVSFEIHSRADRVEEQLVVSGRDTAEAVARHVRSTLDAETTIRNADLPIEEDDRVAGARFRYKEDTLFPVTTARTADAEELGTLHHVLDDLAATDNARAMVQVVAEPIRRPLPIRMLYSVLRPFGISAHWTTRWERGSHI